MPRDAGRRVALLARHALRPEGLAWWLIGLGVVLRVAQYAANRSLWGDEASLALNILNRTPAGLLRPLDLGQGAPVGFLMAEKLAVHLFGSGEYALRLVPLLSGILALVLFFEVARRSIRPAAVPVAVGLFAVLGPLIYYSSEVKQYSSDVALALWVFSSTQVVGEGGRLSVPRALALALIGAIALWCSYPSIFVLMAAGATAVVMVWRTRDWVAIGRFAVVALIWVLSLAALYEVSLRYLRTNPYLLTFWQDAFFPLSHVRDSLGWLGRSFLQMFSSPVGLPHLPVVAAVAYLAGALSLWAQNRVTCLALTLPLVFTVAASAFRLYPFAGRVLLFAVPFIVLLIAEGVERIAAATRRRSPWIGALLVGLVFSYPVGTAGVHLLKPRTHEEIKPVMAYLRAHEQRDDVLHLFSACDGCETIVKYTVPAFTYYAARYGVTADSRVGGTILLDEHWEKYLADLDRLKGQRRVWILFSNLGDDAREYFLHALDARGTRLDSFRSIGFRIPGEGGLPPAPALYLYDLGT